VAAGVSISADGGTARNATSWPGGYEVAAIDTRNPARLYAYTSSPVLGQQGIARSIDGGVSFRPIIGTGHLFLGFDPVTPSIFYVQRTSSAGGYSFEVLKTVDDGATFTSILQQTGPSGEERSVHLQVLRVRRCGLEYRAGLERREHVDVDAHGGHLLRAGVGPQRWIQRGVRRLAGGWPVPGHHVGSVTVQIGALDRPVISNTQFSTASQARWQERRRLG
jgi:hypothetical protein